MFLSSDNLTFSGLKNNFYASNASLDLSKTAFICLGNMDRADDAFGIIVGDVLKKKYANVYIERDIDVSSAVLKVIEDNTIQSVVFIDAIDMDAQPGTIYISSKIENALKPISTHQIPFTELKKTIFEYDKNFVLIGVQVNTVKTFEKMSEVVKNRAQELIELLMGED